MTDWTGVRERVLAPAAVPGGGKVLGARAHGFALEAPLTAPEVVGLQAWPDVEPPEDYRSFLLDVGTDLHPMRSTDGSPLDFAGWYLGWLAAAEAACGPA